MIKKLGNVYGPFKTRVELIGWGEEYEESRMLYIFWEKGKLYLRMLKCDYMKCETCRKLVERVAEILKRENVPYDWCDAREWPEPLVPLAIFFGYEPDYLALDLKVLIGEEYKDEPAENEKKWAIEVIKKLARLFCVDIHALDFFPAPVYCEWWKI